MTTTANDAAPAGDEEADEREEQEEQEEEEGGEEADGAGAGEKKKRARSSSGGTKKPKAGPSGYQMYSSEARPALKEKEPGLSFGDTTKRLSEMWKGLSAAEKEVYNAKAKPLRDEANKRIAQWKKENPEEAEKKGKGKKSKTGGGDDEEKSGGKKARAKKDPNMPSRGRTAYFIYMAEVRERIKTENPGIKVTEISTKVSAEWNKLTSAEKVPYNEKAATEKKVQDQKRAEYLEAHPELAAAAAAESSKSGARKKKSSDSVAGLSDAEEVLQKKVDKLKKLLKDCGFTPRITVKDPREEQIEKLEQMVREKGIELSWKVEKRAEFRRNMESKRELEGLTENSKIMATSDKRKKARVDYATKSKVPSIAGVSSSESDEEDDDDNDLFSKEESD